jgi:hypothetical protein
MSKDFKNSCDLIWGNVGHEYNNLSDYHFPSPTKLGHLKYRIKWLLGIYLFEKYQAKKIYKKITQQAVKQNDNDDTYTFKINVKPIKKNVNEN